MIKGGLSTKSVTLLVKLDKIPIILKLYDVISFRKKHNIIRNYVFLNVKEEHTAEW